MSKKDQNLFAVTLTAAACVVGIAEQIAAASEDETGMVVPCNSPMWPALVRLSKALQDMRDAGLIEIHPTH